HPLDPAKLSDVIATALDKLQLGELTVVFALLPANWQPEQMGLKLDVHTRDALQSAPVEELAETLSMERLTEIAERRLERELNQLDEDLPKSLGAKLLRVEQTLDQLHAPIRVV